MIAIVDYGLGNLASVVNALDKLGVPNQISSSPAVLKKAKGIILPGVGAAGQGMRNLKEKNLDQVMLREIKKGKPALGICLGMQLLFSFSEEGSINCLNLIKGTVNKFNTKLKIPEIGWNQVEVNKNSKLLKGIKNNSYFYFVNSYYCSPEDKAIVMGNTDYEQPFCSILKKDNLYGVQFHPEKSGDVGLQLLKNFWEILC